jgi:hypothetical protein
LVRLTCAQLLHQQILQSIVRLLLHHLLVELLLGDLKTSKFSQGVPSVHSNEIILRQQSRREARTVEGLRAITETANLFELFKSRNTVRPVSKRVFSGAHYHRRLLSHGYRFFPLQFLGFLSHEGGGS